MGNGLISVFRNVWKVVVPNHRACAGETHLFVSSPPVVKQRDANKDYSNV